MLHALSSNIWCTEVTLGDYDVRAALICSEERAVVWDTLSHPDDMKPLLPQIDGRELIIIYSHADWDHVWGSAGLPYQEADIIAHEFCLKRFSTDVPLTLTEKKIDEAAKWEAVKLIAPNTTFRQEFSLDLGPELLTLHQLPGHTPDSIVAFLPEQGVLLMGDAVETPFPMVPEKASLQRWIAGLQHWSDDPRVQTVIPSHGAIGGPDILRQNISYLQSLLEGQDIALPQNLSDFYRTTHQENLRACRDDE
ncbi:MAG: MBL fold metallo-hydrolase [bacterium]|nr:MBL fold metallo-hydrolase [bacterium]